MKVERVEIKKDKVEIVGQAEINKHQPQYEIKTLKKGHTLWEINLETGTIAPATYDDEVNVELAKLGPEANLRTIKKKVRMQKDCIYFGALNIRNACRHFEKQAKKLL